MPRLDDARTLAEHTTAVCDALTDFPASAALTTALVGARQAGLEALESMDSLKFTAFC